VNEFELIHRYFTQPCVDSDVLVGIGDDGAVLRPATGRDLVSVVDTQVEGVHFPASIGARDIGYRAVAVNLSDIAAMAGRPRWMTLALTLPTVDAYWLEEFSLGLREAADEFNVSLVGGDTTSGQQTVISIQITGDVLPDTQLTRSGAHCGDRIYVSGTPGDAAGGLELIQADTVSSVAARALAERFRRPSARVILGQAIASLASAAIDISDGLYGDTYKLLQASDVGGQIDVDRLPLSDALLAEFGLQRAQRLALGGGDDYELCFTVAPDDEAVLIEVALEQDVKVSCIGVVTDGKDLGCFNGGTVFDYSDPGYQHFGGSGT